MHSGPWKPFHPAISVLRVRHWQVQLNNSWLFRVYQCAFDTVLNRRYHLQARRESPTTSQMFACIDRHSSVNNDFARGMSTCWLPRSGTSCDLGPWQQQLGKLALGCCL